MRALVLSAALCLASTAFAATPDADAMMRRPTNLPAEELGLALKTLASQRGFQFVYRADLVSGIKTHGAHGNLTTGEALSQLLQGTGLTYSYLGEKAITIAPAGAAPPVRQGAADQQSHDDKKAVRSFSDRFRMAEMAQGEDQSAAAAVEANGASGSIRTLQEIVVTAEKRPERLMDVPMSVSELSADSLLQSDQLRIQDYFTSIPGLSLSQTGDGFTTVAIRGVISGLGTNPTVGVMIDGVPYGSSTLIGYGARLLPDLDPTALSRIEVLRGPQGTLYGASSMGGLIDYITADPSTRRVSGHIEVTGDTVDSGGSGFGVQGSVNLPVTDTLALLASGFYRRDPGYVDNTFTGQSNVNLADVSGGHLAALWTPTEAVSVKVTALLQRTQADGSADVNTDYQFQPTAGLTQTFVRNSGQYSNDVSFFDAVVNVDLGRATLTSLTGYNENKFYGTFDYTPTFGGFSQLVFGPAVTGATVIDDPDTKKVSQEVRLASKGHSVLEWIVGGFYTNEFTAQPANALLATDASTGATAGALLLGPNQDHFREIAGFADLTFHLSDALAIQAGGRYSKSDQSYYEVDSGALLGPTPALTQAGTSASASTFLASVQYRFSRDWTAYVRSASGYRVGGPNPGAVVGFPASFAPDKTYNYEIGVKGDLLDHRLRFDADAFYIDWKNIQLVNYSPAGFQYYDNGGTAKSDGFEFSVSARPIDGLTVSANAGYTNAVLTQDLPATSNVGYSGDRLPDSSRFTGSLDLQQDVSLGADLTGFVGSSLSYVGDRLSDFPTAGSIRLRFPGYYRWDLRAGLERGDWTLQAFAQNVANAEGVVSGQILNTSAIATETEAYEADLIQPRTIGLSVGFRF